jgi:hypothetical protein
MIALLARGEWGWNSHFTQGDTRRRVFQPEGCHSSEAWSSYDLVFPARRTNNILHIVYLMQHHDYVGTSLFRMDVCQ